MYSLTAWQWLVEVASCHWVKFVALSCLQNARKSILGLVRQAWWPVSDQREHKEVLATAPSRAATNTNHLPTNLRMHIFPLQLVTVSHPRWWTTLEKYTYAVMRETSIGNRDSDLPRFVKCGSRYQDGDDKKLGVTLHTGT